MEGNGLEDPVMRSDITCCQVDKRWTYTEDDTFSCNFYHSSPHPLCVCLLSLPDVTALVRITQALQISAFISQELLVLFY